MPFTDGNKWGKGREAAFHVQHNIAIQKATRDWADEYTIRLVKTYTKYAAAGTAGVWLLLGDDIKAAADWIQQRWYEGWEFASDLYGYASEGATFIEDQITKWTTMANVFTANLANFMATLGNLARMLGVDIDQFMDIMREIAEDGLFNFLLDVDIGSAEEAVGDWFGDLFPGDTDEEKAENAGKVAELLAKLDRLRKELQDELKKFPPNPVRIAAIEAEIALTIAELATLGVNV